MKRQATRNSKKGKQQNQVDNNNHDQNQGYGKLPYSTVMTTQGGGGYHNRVDSNTGLLNNRTGIMEPTERDNWMDNELLNNNNHQQIGSSFTGNTKVDMNSSQLQIKNNKDHSQKQQKPNANFQRQGTNKQKLQGSTSQIPDDDYENQMEKIINDYDKQQNQHPNQQSNNGTDKLVPSKSSNSNQLRQFMKQGSVKSMNRFQAANTSQGKSNYDVSNPIMENIEQSFAQSRSNIASMIQQYGHDADPLPDVDDILEEEDNIKEASQFRSRDIIMRQRSGNQQNKYRTLTTQIRDPDAELLENETEAQIMKIKKFCRKMCRCCKKKVKLDDSFNFTSGESDLDCQEMYLAMDFEEQQNRIIELWQRTLAKAKGAVKVIEIFGDLNRRIYLYGSDKKHDYLIEQDKLKPLPFVLFPQSKTKNIWNLIMMLVVIYTGTYIPYKTAFIEDSSDLVNNIELGIDSLFIIDLIVNFISAYEDSEKNIEFRLTKIAQSYIMSWFLFDVVSCIPFQYLDFTSSTDNGDFVASYDEELVNTEPATNTLRMLQMAVMPFSGATMRILQTTGSTGSSGGSSGSNGQNNNSLRYSKLLKLTRLPRLYKLLRILRLFKMMRLLKYNRNIKRLFDQLKLNPGYMKMITVSVTVLFLVHLVSCFYFMVASFTDFDPDSWVVKKNLQDDSNFSQYITAMYWAFQTLTTVGYGDVQGDTTFERVYCLLWMIFGVAFYSFTIGNLQSIISTIDVKASELSAKLNTLTGFAKRTKLPDNIVMKIKRFLENNNANNIALSDSRQMLNELPSTLRAEVVKQTYADIIEKVKFFNKKDSDFLWAFLPALKPMKVYSKDILYSQGDHPEEVFFIQKGRVKLCYDINDGEGQYPINIPFNMYVEGSYFGDLEILIKKYRKVGRDGSAIVDSECHLLVIGAKELKAILKYFKEIETQMITTAQKRRRHHQRQIEGAKQRYMEKKVKALKNNTLFQNKNALNPFSNWKKRSKKSDNFISRAKASRKKLEMIASHKTGHLEEETDEDMFGQQQENKNQNDANNNKNTNGGGGEDVSLSNADNINDLKNKMQSQKYEAANSLGGQNLQQFITANTAINSNNLGRKSNSKGVNLLQDNISNGATTPGGGNILKSITPTGSVRTSKIRKQETVSDYDDSGNEDEDDDEDDDDEDDSDYNENKKVKGKKTKRDMDGAVSIGGGISNLSQIDDKSMGSYMPPQSATIRPVKTNNINNNIFNLKPDNNKNGVQQPQQQTIQISTLNDKKQNNVKQDAKITVLNENNNNNNKARATIQPQSIQTKDLNSIIEQSKQNQQRPRDDKKNNNDINNNQEKKQKRRSKSKNKKKKISDASSNQDGFKHLKNEKFDYDKKAYDINQPQSQYDHEKQMRLFNDTMSALALNAYEIKEVNETIGEQLQYRNSKLDKMEGMSVNIENSLTHMEMMINKIMESI